VQTALADMPDTMRAPSSLSEAFMAIDPVLSGMNRQMLDADQHFNKLVAAFGSDDAMVEIASAQRDALKQAYHTRLQALRRKREDSRRAHALLDESESELQGKNRAKTDENRQRILKQEEERLLRIA